MLRVGLTGGLASGKSFAGSILAGLGCYVLHADKLGHAILEAEARPAVIHAFGPAIVDPTTGRIDRKKLGAIVFEDPARLETLNRIVHPFVFQKQEEWFAGIALADPRAIAVVEAAIMIETGSYARYQRLILAVCSEMEQVERAMRRDGLSESEVRARLARQMPLAEKLPYADFVLDTSGTPPETRRRVEAIYAALRKEQE
jgi:dephospho-CoA kinase